MRNPWVNSLEAVFDLLLDDYYDGHPNREALLSGKYDSIGIACNCHARFGQICVFELTGPAHHKGEVVPFYGENGHESCLDQCWDQASMFMTNTDVSAVFKHCCGTLGVCGIIASDCDIEYEARVG